MCIRDSLHPEVAAREDGLAFTFPLDTLFDAGGSLLTVAGESITLTATPAGGWRVAGWSGTNIDASTATTNTVTMPAANHVVSVAYEQAPPTCYTLSRSHTGQGNNPVTAPALSAGCGTGQYVAGELIALTATPAGGWFVTGWGGTNNDASTATTNTVTMPAADHAVSVDYQQASPTCYALTRSHTGQGSDPVATPNQSDVCGVGQYVAGESITLTATPATGWRVAGWVGTNNDGSTSASNTLAMPAADHTARVNYVQQSGSQERAVIPFVLYGQPSFLGPLESEPNSAFGEANGPILLNRTYQGLDVYKRQKPAWAWPVCSTPGKLAARTPTSSSSASSFSPRPCPPDSPFC